MTSTKPSLDQIVDVLAKHFNVNNATIVGWLCDMCEAAAERANHDSWTKNAILKEKP